MATVFTQGTKVRYRHGKGVSTGEIESIEKDRATLITKNNSRVVRPLRNLKRLKSLSE